ncbi:uncharacterized protein LOC126858637 [Cataglyphis hispanica]|uniref:uncharacterized protein LOC126858637 n=1 Tax=Cataglyphis hispanica TaxID=1086592 RepID=UPI0021802BB5|nr:uncharacterized protein LOC126858637 [Cataglyphis hispanica]
MNSDINTDTDDKAQRKIRARKQIDIDDDESDDDHDSDPLRLPSYPKAPIVVYTNTYTGDARNIPKKELKNILKLNIYKGDIQGSPISHREIPKRDNHTQKGNEEYITIENYLHRMDRTLADIKFDINHLIEQYQLILTKMNSNNGSNLTRECHSLLLSDELSKLSFPLKIVEELEYLQCMLFSNEEGLKERMFSILAAIGGSTYEEMVKRMLIYIFTN